MAFSYCSFCGHEYSTIPEKYAHQTCEHCKKIHFRNPIPAVSVLIQDQKSLLLGKRKKDPGKGKWDIIGGFMEPWETPEECAVREVKEETGLDIVLNPLLLTYTDGYDFQNETRPVLSLVYTANYTEGNMQPNDDVEELRWFDAENLPSEMSSSKQLEILEIWKNSLK